MSASRLSRAALAAALLAVCMPAMAGAHPVPFSYVDVRVGGHETGLAVTVVVHVFDLAHDLGVNPPERLLERDILAARSDAATALVRGRLAVSIDGRTLAGAVWARPQPLVERQSVAFEARFPAPVAVGRLTVGARLFPYDPQHKTFVNVYEDDALAAQAIVDGGRPEFEYFSGTRQGVRAVLEKFIPSGVHHILIGPDHLLFLVGLLLLGGTLRQLMLVVTGFTLAHSLTLSLSALNLLVPPAGLIEPAIALSIVYVGADNLLVRGGGRDMRAWIAFGFGFVHGFGFANVLREMGLPGRALGWSLFGFNVGVEIGQLCVVIVVASAFAAIRARSEAAGRQLAFAGSILVMAAGAFWFVQRVFFSGGIT